MPFNCDELHIVRTRVLHWSRRRLASELGVSAQQIWNWETSRASPSVHMLDEIQLKLTLICEREGGGYTPQPLYLSPIVMAARSAMTGDRATRVRRAGIHRVEAPLEEDADRPAPAMNSSSRIAPVGYDLAL